MNQILFLISFIFLFLMTMPLRAEDDFSPRISIEEVIAKGKQYVVEHDIDLSGKYINTVRYDNDFNNGGRQACWSVLWINTRITKGGGVELRFYADDAVEVRYHK